MKKIISSRLVRFAFKENWLPFLILSVGAGLLGSFVGSAFAGLLGGDSIVNIHDVNTLLKILPFGVVLFTVRAFGFYMKRCDSDFYESLPYTRTQALFSITTALSVLSFGMLTLSSLVSMLVSIERLKDAIFLWGDSLLLLLAYFIACEIAVFATTLAVSITGHSVNAALASFLIILIPSDVVSEIGIIAERSPLTSGKSELFNTSYNLVAAMPGSVPTLSAYIYSAFLVVLFCALSAILFKRRKSEIASSFYANPIVGHILRTALALPVSFVVLEQIMSIGGGNEGEIVAISFLAINFMLVIYFGYELIALRGKRAFANAARGLPILLGINVLVAAIGLTAGAAMDSRVPSAEDIKHVTVSENGAGYYYEYSLSDYVNLRLADVELDSPEAREIIARALKENTEAYKSKKYDQIYYYSDEIYHEINVGITTATGRFDRTLLVSDEDYAALREMLNDNEEHRRLWTDLPEKPYTVFQRYLRDGFVLNDSEAELVYEALLRDVNTIPFEDWYFANQHGGTYGNSYELTVVVKEKGSAFMLSLPVSEATPESYALISEMLDKKAKTTYDGIVEDIRAAMDGYVDPIEMSITVVCDGNYYFNWFCVDGTDKGRDQAEFIINCMTAERPRGENQVVIGIYTEEMLYYSFDLSDKYTLEELKQFFEDETTKETN